MTDTFDRGREIERRLYGKLNTQPTTEVTGIVGASGVRGRQGGGEELWTLIFSFASWRDAEGNLHKEKLTVRNEVTKEEFDHFKGMVSAYQVIRLLVRIGQDDAFDCPQAILVELLNLNVADEELQGIAENLRTPVSIATKRFGKLALDRTIGWYEGTVRIGWRKIRISLEPDDVNSPQAVIETAERLWESIRDWDAKARKRATEELLSVKNGFWLIDGEQPLTAKEFQKRMKPDSIVVREDGEFEFWYDDGDLFSGHSIEVRGDLDGGLIHASFHG